MRLAAIDLGSNTIRLLVADGPGELRPVHAEQQVTRLGEGLGGTGRLAPAAVARALATVRAYRDRARALGAARVIVVATAAAREAANRRDLLGPLEAEDGLDVRVASGTEEARLTLLGVARGLPGLEGPFGLVDIGGGSTELVVADGERPLATASLPLGVVRLAEAYFHGDPVDWSEYRACAAYVAERLAVEVWPAVRPLAPGRLVGTGGTVTALAALDLGLARYDASRVHGHHLRRDALERLGQRLGRLPLAERARLPGLEAGRADLLIPGVAIAVGILAGLGLTELTVSDTGLREGILHQILGDLDCIGAQQP